MKKAKFSVIDILIVLFLIVVIIFGFKKFKDGGIIMEKPQEKVSFSVLINRVEKGSGDVIKEGDEVCISLKEKEYATVTKVTESPYYENCFVPNLGEYVSKQVDGKSDLLVELECMAEITENEILDGKAPIRVGEEAHVRGKGYSFKGYIVFVDEKGDE